MSTLADAVFGCFECYFSLERKVTKSSRLQRLGYSGKRLRSTSGTRSAQTAAALSASSSASALRPPAEVDQKKALLSMGMADTDSYIRDAHPLTGRIGHPHAKRSFAIPASGGEREAE